MIQQYVSLITHSMIRSNSRSNHSNFGVGKSENVILRSLHQLWCDVNVCTTLSVVTKSQVLENLPWRLPPIITKGTVTFHWEVSEEKDVVLFSPIQVHIPPEFCPSPPVQLRVQCRWWWWWWLWKRLGFPKWQGWHGEGILYSAETWQCRGAGNHIGGDVAL